MTLLTKDYNILKLNHVDAVIIATPDWYHPCN